MPHWMRHQCPHVIKAAQALPLWHLNVHFAFFRESLGTRLTQVLFVLCSGTRAWPYSTDYSRSPSVVLSYKEAWRSLIIMEWVIDWGLTKHSWTDHISTYVWSINVRLVRNVEHAYFLKKYLHKQPSKRVTYLTIVHTYMAADQEAMT